MSQNRYEKKDGGIGRKLLECSWLLRGNKLKKDRKVCAVCLEDLGLEQQVMNLSCSHKYHSACLLPWLAAHPHCPYCRTPVQPWPHIQGSRLSIWCLVERTKISKFYLVLQFAAHFSCYWLPRKFDCSSQVLVDIPYCNTPCSSKDWNYTLSPKKAITIPSCLHEKKGPCF